MSTLQRPFLTITTSTIETKRFGRERKPKNSRPAKNETTPRIKRKEKYPYNAKTA